MTWRRGDRDVMVPGKPLFHSLASVSFLSHEVGSTAPCSKTRQAPASTTSTSARTPPSWMLLSQSDNLEGEVAEDGGIPVSRHSFRSADFAVDFVLLLAVVIGVTAFSLVVSLASVCVGG